MNSSRARWLALGTLCIGNLMIVLDTNVVTVALPAIQSDLHFAPTALVWVANAYLLAYAGFLLLGGRLGDLLGARRIFLVAVATFTVASAACAAAPAAGFLVAGRAVQGFGGALLTAVCLALIVTLFEEPGERAKAMAFYGFVMAGGGALGSLLGGVLTGLLDWRWVFIVNVPIGAAVWVMGARVLPPSPARRTRLDVPGAVLVTVALVLLVYAIVGVPDHTTARTLVVLVAGAVLLAAFLAREARSTAPLVPLRLFRVRSLATSQVVGALWSAAMFAAFYLSSLFLQQVRGDDALQVGLAFLPQCVVMAYCSVRWSGRSVVRFGTRLPMVVGLALVAVALALLALAPADGSYLRDVLPAFVLLGVGAAFALNPVLLTAMSHVTPEDTGLASGLVNTSFSIGGALGLAVLTSVATSRTAAAAADGVPLHEALTSGFHAAFAVGAVFAATAVAVALSGRRDAARPVRPVVGAEEV